MERKEVQQIIKSARDKGERPDLSGLDLSETNLSALDLKNVKLGGPLGNLTCADLRGADLSEASLSKAKFNENPLILTPDDPNPCTAKYNNATIFPQGFNRYDELENMSR